MNLLIITQAVDKNNPVLGFMHRWIKEFAKKFESIVVVCLEKRAYDLPQNVKVLSLGKESGRSRIKHLYRFYKYIWQERRNYDAVFVHMNQEYVLLGGKIWWLLGKKVYMWRNHPSGSMLTDIASIFCKKIFCTSKYSYTAKYKKTILMPVGIDTKIFRPIPDVTRIPHSILFLGRIAPIKAPHLLIDALAEVKDEEWSATIVGDALSKDHQYYEGLKIKAKNYGLDGKIIFKVGATNQDTPKIYSAHEIFVNLSPSGMFDKTIFEATSCGCLALASNKNLEGRISPDFIFMEGDKEELKSKLLRLLSWDETEKLEARKGLHASAEGHSLKTLVDKIVLELSS